MDCDQGALLTDLQAGKPVWGDVYRCCRERIYKAANRALDGGTVRGEAAEDFVGHAIVTAMLSDVGVVDRSICAWLAVIAHNLAIDEVRRANVARRLEPKVADIVAAEDVADVVERMILSEALSPAIAELSEPEQIVVRERLMNKHPAKEVATELPGNPKPQRVPQLVASALRKLAASPAFTDAVPLDPEADPARTGKTRGGKR